MYIDSRNVPEDMKIKIKMRVYMDKLFEQMTSDPLLTHSISFHKHCQTVCVNYKEEDSIGRSLLHYAVLENNSFIAKAIMSYDVKTIEWEDGK